MNQKSNIKIEDLSKETQDIILTIRDFIIRARKERRLPLFVQEKKSDQDLLALGFLRDTLYLKTNASLDAFSLSIYCFNMVRYFGITAVYDRFVLFFLEGLQLKQDDRYYELSNYLFPKWSKLNSRYSIASYEGQPFYERVYKKLIKLGYKKKIDVTSDAFSVLKKEFKFIKENSTQRNDMFALIEGKLVHELAEYICGFYFELTPASFQKARQLSSKFINR